MKTRHLEDALTHLESLLREAQYGTTPAQDLMIGTLSLIGDVIDTLKGPATDEVA